MKINYSFKNILLIISALIVIGCQSINSKSEPKKSECVEGELYFKLIDIGSFYGIEDSIIENFQTELNKISLDSSSTEKFLVDYYHILNENDLIKTPYIRMIIDSTEHTQVFMNKRQYRKVKHYNHWDLEEEKKKVILKLQGHSINSYIFKCDKILTLNKVDGITQWDK